MFRQVRARKFDIAIPFSTDSGAYEVYLSHIQPPDGWGYARGDRFLRIGVEAVDGQLRILDHEITTVRRCAGGGCGRRCRN